MIPDQQFSDDVRARLIALGGKDKGPFRIGHISTGPKWPTMTREEQVDAIARSMVNVVRTEKLDGDIPRWRTWRLGDPPLAPSKTSQER